MKTQTLAEVDITEKDVKIAKKSLDTASFRERFINTGCNVADPVWKAPNGKPINEYVKKQMGSFRKDLGPIAFDKFQTGVFQKYDSNSLLTIDFHGRHIQTPPKPRDLLHVYGPDRDNIKDAKKYYRYAWTDKGPHGIIHSTDQEIIREGKLMCNSYSYSGQSSFALVGAGMFFQPVFGDAKVMIRPYVQWLTSASFTGTENAPASAKASLGIYVESWNLNGSGYFADRDFWMPVWSQNTQSFMSGVTAGGSATGVDGLEQEILCVSQRKYSVFVYVYLETTAGPQQGKNELRYVGIDIDATVPYVVMEEKLI
jgi:hypothetical protein